MRPDREGKARHPRHRKDSVTFDRSLGRVEFKNNRLSFYSTLPDMDLLAK